MVLVVTGILSLSLSFGFSFSCTVFGCITGNGVAFPNNTSFPNFSLILDLLKLWFEVEVDMLRFVTLSFSLCKYRYN